MDERDIAEVTEIALQDFEAEKIGRQAHTNALVCADLAEVLYLGEMLVHICKKHLIGNLNAALEPFRAKRAAMLASSSDVVRDVLHAGDENARRVAEETMEKVRAAVKLSPEP